MKNNNINTHRKKRHNNDLQNTTLDPILDPPKKKTKITMFFC